MNARELKVCACCGVEFTRESKVSARQWARRRYCTQFCVRVRLPVKRVMAGEFVVHSDGYIKVYCPMHPSSDGTYVYLHRLVMERKLGRHLLADELVHHVNADKSDNRPENLALTDRTEHLKLHARFTDAEIAEMVLAGERARSIARRGVSSRSVARVRKQLRESGAIA